jgi:magnesium-transporting ATPase (P-type)
MPAKIRFFSLFISLVLFFSLAGFVSAADCDPTVVKECPAAGILQLQELLTRIINISVTIAFMALTVWLIWGALKFFITSGGDPKAISHAWSSVTWAFMGLFFLVLAYLALKLISDVTGAPVTEYCLGFKPYCI